MSVQTITCPQCKEQISIDDVLTHQIEEDIRKRYLAKLKQNEQLLAEKELEVTAERKKLAERTQELELSVQKKVQLALTEEKKKLSEQIKTEMEKESAEELKLLKDQLDSKEKKLSEARQAELELRKKAVELEEERKEFELTKQRQLDEERKKIAEVATKKATDEQQFKLAELSKQLSDAVKVNEELSRKLQQGSQQNQGEVFELHLEDTLRREFPHDEITPVGKGVNGADVIQHIKDHYGREAGIIIWELKNTKSWTDSWVQKLKDDQRREKAALAILVTTALPKNVKTFSLHEGVWVTSFDTAIALAVALRTNLLQIASMKQAAVGKNEKMEVLYNYLTSTEFKHRIEGIVESFTMMKNELDKERMAYKRIWERREKLIERVLDNTVGMYGDLEGMIGTQLPRIEQLELENGEQESLL